MCIRDRVFVRVDYNVPMEEKDGKMVINDSTRIKETLPTLRLLISNCLLYTSSKPNATSFLTGIF